MDYESSQILEVVQRCESEIALCDSRIESGESVLQMCKDQMNVLKKKKEFFSNIKILMVKGEYHEADMRIQLKLNEE